MKLLLLLALLLTLEACQNPSRLQAAQSGPATRILHVTGTQVSATMAKTAPATNVPAEPVKSPKRAGNDAGEQRGHTCDNWSGIGDEARKQPLRHSHVQSPECRSNGNCEDVGAECQHEIGQDKDQEAGCQNSVTAELAR